jgi:hypothetical protein
MMEASVLSLCSKPKRKKGDQEQKEAQTLKEETQWTKSTLAI